MQGVHPTIPSAVNSFFLYIPSKPSGKILELYKNCPSSRYLTCSIIFFLFVYHRIYLQTWIEWFDPLPSSRLSDPSSLPPVAELPPAASAPPPAPASPPTKEEEQVVHSH